MSLKSVKFVLTFAVIATITGAARSWAQDAGKSKDDALDVVAERA